MAVEMALFPGLTSGNGFRVDFRVRSMLLRLKLELGETRARRGGGHESRIDNDDQSNNRRFIVRRRRRRDAAHGGRISVSLRDVTPEGGGHTRVSERRT